MIELTPVRNELLLALSPEIRLGLLPKLQPVTLPLRQTLSVPGEPIKAVYFIEHGWASMVAHLDQGTQADVGLIGREGMVGVALVAGVETEFSDIYMQASGTGLRMDATAFARELEEIPTLRRLLLRYNEALHAQTAQTAACNGRHDLEHRLARWLLMAHDRGEGSEVLLTQEFLAIMLCVHRPSVTVMARKLQKAGIIRYAQGRIIVLDRTLLESTACDCYKSVAQRFHQLLG